MAARRRAGPTSRVGTQTIAIAALLAAGPGVDGTAQTRDSTARLERVADGVYAIIHDDATDQWPHGNTGVIVGDDGVAVIDATYLPSRARADIALIRSITDQPVRYLITTHWHFDHNNGAVAYREAYPGVTVVSERETRDFIELNAVWWARMSTASGSARRVALRQLEELIAAGRDSLGRELTRRERDSLAGVAARRRAELEELGTLEVVTPDLVFERELRLAVGGRRIVLRDHGRANSPHDVTIYLPDERVLFTGDILVQSPLPYLGSSWPVPWIGVLRKLEAIPVAAIVPGHGPVLRDHGYTRQVRRLLEAATAGVRALARRGLTLDRIQDTLDLDDVRRSTPVWAAPELREAWRANTRVLIERAWRGVRGQG